VALSGWLDRGGKRIRPRLVYECTRALGALPNAETATLAAVAELIHTASLCHDDVVDAAGMRRGHASLPARVGNHRAVLVGDLLVSAAWELACRHLPAAIAGRFAATVRGMARAELDADGLLWNADASIRDCLRVVQGKTAGLFATCAWGAAVVAGAPRPAVRAFFHFGRAFGEAFQVRDDVRDYFPGGPSWGKEPLKDLKQGLMTLPMALALRTPGEAAIAVRSYFRGGGRVTLDTASALQLLRETHAASSAATLTRRLLDRRLARVARHAEVDGLHHLVAQLFPATPS